MNRTCIRKRIHEQNLLHELFIDISAKQPAMMIPTLQEKTPIKRAMNGFPPEIYSLHAYENDQNPSRRGRHAVSSSHEYHLSMRADGDVSGREPAAAAEGNCKTPTSRMDSDAGECCK